MWEKQEDMKGRYTQNDKQIILSHTDKMVQNKTDKSQPVWKCEMEIRTFLDFMW